MSLPKPYYQDSAVTIYHGDCRKIIPLLGHVDLVQTDPPYLAKDIGVNKRKAITGGLLSPKDYTKLCHTWFKLASKKTDRLIFSPGIKHLWEYPPAPWTLCWNKPGAVAYSAFGGYTAWEPLLVYGKLPKGCRIGLDVLTYTPVSFARGVEREHPCPKHLGMWSKLLSMVSLPGEIILDPFMGSGTTLLAAKENGRRAIGIETEIEWCDLAVRRLRQEILI